MNIGNLTPIEVLELKLAIIVNNNKFFKIFMPHVHKELSFFSFFHRIIYCTTSFETFYMNIHCMKSAIQNIHHILSGWLST